MCNKSVFYDTGKRNKPPIPTPRPKDLGLRNLDGYHVRPISSTLDMTSPAHEISSNTEDNLKEEGNIYETLDFRGSLNVQASDEKLPDILMHTRPTQNKQPEEIYETLDTYQVHNKLFLLLICQIY